MKLLFNFFCRDIEAQLGFYQALLGLPEAVHSHSPIYRAVQGEGFSFGFHAQPAYALLGLAGREPAGAAQPTLKGYPTFQLGSPSAVSEMAARAAALGGSVLKAPYPTYYSQWQCVLADPEDNVFRISAEGLPDGVSAPILSL